MKKTLFLLLFASISSLAFGSGLKLEKQQVREPFPGRNISAAFFELTNNGDKACTLVSVEADLAGKAELHNHINEDGVMKMREVSQVLIPAGQTTVFKPGSLHIMLYQTEKGMVDGATVNMTLNFSDCDSFSAGFPVVNMMKAKNKGK